MKEQLIICPKCGGNACHEASNNKLTVWSCFGCGFTSNTTLVENNLENVEAVMPQLYKDLKFKDEKGYQWYPNTVMLDDKSLRLVIKDFPIDEIPARSIFTLPFIPSY